MWRSPDCFLLEEGPFRYLEAFQLIPESREDPEAERRGKIDRF